MAHTSILGLCASILLIGCVPAPSEGEIATGLTGGSAITSAIGGKCLADSGDKTTNGNKIQLWDCDGTDSQTWTYTNGTIVGAGGKCLDIAEDDQSNGTHVQLYQCNGTEAQQWTLSGTSITSTSGLCLDAYKGLNADGTQVQVWACSPNNDNQVWHFGAVQPPTAPPSNNAAKVLSYLSGLKSRSNKRVLSGQHVDIWNGDSVAAAMGDVTPLADETGKSPSILGVVMNYVGNSGAYSISVANDIAKQWWEKGGLIELSIYSDDPTFSANANGYPNGKSIPAAAFHQLTDTSSAAYKQWHKQLDTYAAELHTLTDSGNVVLLRPFIELNGNWNWYGAQSPTDFIFVWKDMYTYLMKDKGLVNVLWIYNVNAEVGRYSDYYPGASYVDIVGMDVYAYADNYVSSANSGGMYSFLVSTGKPLILPEVGLATGTPGKDSVDDSKIIDIVKASLPDVVGFVYWADSYSMTNQNGASTLLDDSWVVNIGDLPKGI